MRNKIILVVLVFLTLYVISYGILSLCGGYRFVASGRIRPVLWAMDDTFAWEPRYGTCYPFRDALGKNTHRMDVLGFLYFPMISFDQAFVHRSRPYYLLDGTGSITNSTWLSTDQWHPLDRRLIRATDAAMSHHQPEIDAASNRNDTKEVSRIKKLAREEAQKEVPNYFSPSDIH